ncbi:Clustered mitochondria protein [Meyerozyma sp. JA9]|nr:Clustered mitochondria protein [Meyerozyma sp. JA9]
MTEDNAEGQENALTSPNLVSVEIALPKDVSGASKPLTVKMAESDSISDLTSTLGLLSSMRDLTNYNVYYRSTNLSETFDDLSPISEVFSVLEVELQQDVKLELRHKPYTLAAVYEHLNKFREVIGLHFLDRRAFELGELSGVGKFDQLQLSQVPDQKEDEKDKAELAEDDRASISAICDRILDETKLDLSEHGKFYDIYSDLQVPIKSLTISQWSPVSPKEAARGDLLYLALQTLENDTYHITCHLSGFFVNSCSTVNFNPARKSSHEPKFLFFDLVSSLSPAFAKAIARNETILANSSRYAESYLIPSHTSGSYPWLVDTGAISRKPDQSRPQLSIFNNGVDGSDNVKDWNEDFQAIRELPSATVNERILRERLAIKLLSEFTKQATETAVNIIKGNLTPMNPNESVEQHIYMRNGIFYSSGVNATGAFDETGGNEAARYAAAKDLAGVKLLNRIDAKGIYHLATCVVDYMGRRIVCQAPVPGILNDPVVETEEAPADKVCYGLSTDGTKVYSDAQFHEALKPVAEAFHMKPHKVTLPNGFETKEEIALSKDSKGIRGTDGRNYVIDLYRSTPLDIEFIEKHWKPESDDSYPHREAVLRHEAVEEWWRRRALAIFKSETERLEAEKGTEKNGEETEKPQILLDAQKVSFNPDAFTHDVDEEDKEVVREMSSFVTKQLIEEFVEESKKQLCPFDGTHLSSLLHKAGINLRYLGLIATRAQESLEAFEQEEKRKIEANEKAIEEETKKAEKAEKKEDKPEEKSEEKAEKTAEENVEERAEEESSKGIFDPIKANLNSVRLLAIQEMIARAVKHIFRSYSQTLPSYLLPYFVAHFHNCLLGSQISGKPEISIDETLSAFVDPEVLNFTTLDKEQVLSIVEKEVLLRFRFELPENWINALSPITLMREIAHKFGIQWKTQGYAFTAEGFKEFQESTENVIVHKQKPSKKSKKRTSPPVEEVSKRSTIFVADDIISFTPSVKSSSYKATLLDEIFEAARGKIAAEEKDSGVTLLNELVSIYEQIYGVVHPETSNFYSVLSQFYSDLGFTTEASEVARKACVLFERTAGFDSFETISSFINSAYFEAANNSYVNAFKLYEKALRDWDFVFGSHHPSSVTTLTNLAEILAQLKIVDKANRTFSAALELSDRINGEDSQITAMIHYRFAGTLVNENRFDEALGHFEKAHTTFSRHIGPNDRLTKDCSNYVANLKTYIAYMKQQAKDKNKPKSKVKAPPVPPQAATKKSKNKSKTAQPDPEIASQSVDEILKFIEGKTKTKKK